MFYWSGAIACRPVFICVNICRFNLNSLILFTFPPVCSVSISKSERNICSFDIWRRWVQIPLQRYVHIIRRRLFSASARLSANCEKNKPSVRTQYRRGIVASKWVRLTNCVQQHAARTLGAMRIKCSAQIDCNQDTATTTTTTRRSSAFMDDTRSTTNFVCVCVHVCFFFVLSLLMLCDRSE